MVPMPRFTNIVIGIAVSIISLSIWAYLNQPEQQPQWPSRVQGFSFQPMRADDDPSKQRYPTVEQIDQDLALLAGKANAVRTYSVEDVLAEIPGLAKKHNLNINLGAWLNTDKEKNEREFLRFLEVAQQHANIVRAVVGNEVVLRGDLSVAELTAYLDRARATLRIPISTAEPWHVWIDHPELVEHVDYLAVHMLPYWEGIDIDQSVNYIFEKIGVLNTRYPGKTVVIAEVGWPSNGRTRHAAVASESNEAIFLRQFLQRVTQEGQVYYIMEAFDQPWKRRFEGTVGAYWGVYDVERQLKFEFTQPVRKIAHWEILAATSIVLAIITFGLLLIDSKTLRGHGRSFLAVVSYAAATAIVWIVYQYSLQYLTLGSIIIGILLVLGMIGILAVLLAEAHEWAEALWVKKHRRSLVPIAVADDELPFISVHVPAYNEPPEMLKETLRALAELNYPRYEVIVIDNNTKDPQVWQPVESYCRELGPRFKFHHVDPLSGFKAGALNYALQHTASEATVIAAIDSDYVVDRQWLRDLAPQFTNPEVAIVQAPQDYRDEQQSLFKAMCYSEYRGFFYIGMITRNERNAIIQHGTMTMIRKATLQNIGGWGEWCITEDAELGFRIFEEGAEALYVAKSYGRGLMPDTFSDYKKQRFRWAYGAMQILKHHLPSLTGVKPSRLTNGQRYHFIAGWLPWIADGVNLFFTFAALVWSLLMATFPKNFDPPMIIFSILPLSLFCFKIAKILFLYRATVNVPLKSTLYAALAGLALSHTIALAIVQGLVTKSKPFFRTPKLETPSLLLRALVDARWEFALALLLWLSVIAVDNRQSEGGLDLQVWLLLLAIQSLPYIAAVVMAVISALPEKKAAP